LLVEVQCTWKVHRHLFEVDPTRLWALIEPAKGVEGPLNIQNRIMGFIQYGRPQHNYALQQSRFKEKENPQNLNEPKLPKNAVEFYVLMFPNKQEVDVI
jgi:hypothetical protein